MTVETFKSWNDLMDLMRHNCNRSFDPTGLTQAQRVKGQARTAANRPLSAESAEKRKLLALPKGDTPLKR